MSKHDSQMKVSLEEIIKQPDNSLPPKLQERIDKILTQDSRLLQNFLRNLEKKQAQSNDWDERTDGPILIAVRDHLFKRDTRNDSSILSLRQLQDEVAALRKQQANPDYTWNPKTDGEQLLRLQHQLKLKRQDSSQDNLKNHKDPVGMTTENIKTEIASLEDIQNNQPDEWYPMIHGQRLLVPHLHK